jgi:hypothetical protein
MTRRREVETAAGPGRPPSDYGTVHLPGPRVDFSLAQSRRGRSTECADVPVGVVVGVGIAPRFTRKCAEIPEYGAAARRLVPA